MSRGIIFAVPLAGVLLALSQPAHAEQNNEANFPQLVTGNGTSQMCRLQSAEKCINHVWNVVDRNGDGMVSAEEIDRFVQHMRRWNKTTDRRLKDRSIVGVGLLALNLVGTDRIIESYDENADGLLSKDEALADLIFDDRPIAELLLDPSSVSAESVAQRFGVVGSQLVRVAQAVGTRITGGAVDTDIAAKPVEPEQGAEKASSE